MKKHNGTAVCNGSLFSIHIITEKNNTTDAIDTFLFIQIMAGRNKAETYIIPSGTPY